MPLKTITPKNLTILDSSLANSIRNNYTFCKLYDSDTDYIFKKSIYLQKCFFLETTYIFLRIKSKRTCTVKN